MQSEMQGDAERVEAEQREAREKSPIMTQIRMWLPQAGRIEKDVCGAFMNFKPDSDDSDKGGCHAMTWKNQIVMRGDVKCNEYLPVQASGG